MNGKKVPTLKQAVSVSEMAMMLQLSRARFYQLLDTGFFPKPKIDERSKRPYFDQDLQEKLLECRETGVGSNGSLLMFYSPRQKKVKTRAKKVDPQIKELTDTLNSMGLDITAEQVQQGLIEIYPGGTEGQDQGLVVRELYRHFKQK